MKFHSSNAYDKYDSRWLLAGRDVDGSQRYASPLSEIWSPPIPLDDLHSHLDVYTNIGRMDRIDDQHGSFFNKGRKFYISNYLQWWRR